jgi:AcrR family transcriptional regulator
MSTTAGSGPSRRRREPPDVRREQILDAAQATLLSNGLSATTVADVADAAGIAKGTVYLHFQSKTELLVGLRARHVEQFSQRLADTLSASGRTKPMGRFDRFIDEFFDYSVTHRDLHHLLFHEAGFSEDDAFGEVKVLLRTFIEAGMDSGDFAAGDAEIVTDFLISGIHGSLVTALHGTGASAAKHVSGAKVISRRILAPATTS